MNKGLKEKILKLYSEGKAYNDIVDILGCSKSTISFHCGKGQKEKNRNRNRIRRDRKKTIVSFEKEMDDKTWVGSLAEIKVIAALTMDKFHVFSQITGKAPYDLIAVKNNKIIRISVKGTICRINKRAYSYSIQIGRVRSNKNKNIVYKFNNMECDVLAVYIQEIDVVCFIPSNEIKSGRGLTLKTKLFDNGTGSRLLISNLAKINL